MLRCHQRTVHYSLCHSVLEPDPELGPRRGRQKGLPPLHGPPVSLRKGDVQLPYWEFGDNLAQRLWEKPVVGHFTVWKKQAKQMISYKYINLKQKYVVFMIRTIYCFTVIQKSEAVVIVLRLSHCLKGNMNSISTWGTKVDHMMAVYSVASKMLFRSNIFNNHVVKMWNKTVF